MAARRDFAEEVAHAKPIPNIEERVFFGVDNLYTRDGFSREYAGIQALSRKPELWQIARLLLGEDCIHISIGMQAYMGKQGHKQSWHSDSDPDNQPFFFINCLVYLEDQTLNSGLTRLVPGSHRIPIKKRFPDHDDLPGQVAVEVPAGSLCVFHSLCWHSGSENFSDQPRFLLGYHFTRPEWDPAQRPELHAVVRHARGHRRFGKPIFPGPTTEGSYGWEDNYAPGELEKLLLHND